MNRHLHNSDEVTYTPQHGWEQMRFLLDENLPVTPKKNTRQLYTSLFIAVSLLAVLLCGTLTLTDGNHRHLLGGVIIEPSKKQGAVTQINKGNHSLITVANNPVTTKAVTQLYPVTSTISLEKEITDNDNGQVNTAFATGKITDSTNTVDDNEKQQQLSLSNTDTAIKTTTSLTAKNAAPDTTKSWNLYAGVGINAVIGQQQNLQPYPMAAIRYNLSPRFFLSLGISVGSPVSSGSHGVDKTVYLNDTANNIQLYNKITNYSRLYYADIPLLVGININKKLSLLAGLQASVLTGTKNNLSIEQYDFQMRVADAPQSTLLPVATAVSENDYKLKITKIDYRFTTGLMYAVNNASFNLMYQYGLQPVLKGSRVTSGHNQLVTLGVFYKIK